MLKILNILNNLLSFIFKKQSSNKGGEIKMAKLKQGYLSTHFSQEELIRSETATRHCIDNTPNANQLQSLKDLAIDILEPIRVHLKKPVFITSGFRCHELNTKIGSSSRSQHKKGEAADFVVTAPHDITGVWKWIILESGLDFDQIIHEFDRWIHISYKKDGNNRNKVSIAKKINGKTRYFHHSVDDVKNGKFTL